MKPAQAEKSTTFFTVEIPSSLHSRWKSEAAKRRLSMVRMTIDAMTIYLAKPRRTNGHAQERA